MKLIESDKDRADYFLTGIKKDMEVHSNLGAWLLALSQEKRAIQHRVLDALRGPKSAGRPKRPHSDNEWLDAFEAYRDGTGFQSKTDLGAIEEWLTKTETMYERGPNIPFRPNRTDGKQEVRRIRDAIVRARRSRKNIG